MNPLDSVAGLGSTAGIKTASQGMVGLDTDAFMNLLVAQLRYQDPLAPSDANALLQQTSVLAQTELLTKVSEMQQQLLGLQRANIATDLIGKTVAGIAADGTAVTGKVDAVRFASTGPVLIIGDREVALDDATRITGTHTTTPSPDGAAPDTATGSSVTEPQAPAA